MVFDAARRRHAGQLDRAPRWWNRVLGADGYAPLDELPHNWLVHEGDGGPDGLLAWTARGGHDGLLPPFASLDVWLLASASAEAYRDSWAYLTGVDLIDEVRLAERPVSEPVRWLLRDGRALRTTSVVDFVWLRLLDVPAALSARRYACPGSVVLEVRDDDPPGYAAGRYRLTAADGEVRCLRTDEEPELLIAQRALASIYLGGFRLAELPTELAVERTPGALSRVDLMFSTPLPPWNATWF